jgi:hypothetical protein
MARKPRDYKAEFQRRNDLAKSRGFKSYGQQRRYVEYTGTPTVYVIAPPEMPYYPSPRYDYGNYEAGEDTNLDIFMRMAKQHNMEPEEAYDRYMRKSRGEWLSRGQLKDLEMEAFDVPEDETWYE